MKTKVFDATKKEILEKMGFEVELATADDVKAAKSRRVQPLLGNNAEKYGQAIAYIRKSFSSVKPAAKSVTKEEKSGEKKNG